MSKIFGPSIWLIMNNDVHLQEEAVSQWDSPMLILMDDDDDGGDDNRWKLWSFRSQTSTTELHLEP